MASSPAKRAIVVGAGHNGLVCAALLARRGWSVTLLEALASPGGMAGTVKFAEGFRTPRCAHLLMTPDARVVRDLRLGEHGFLGAPAIDTLSLSPDGPVVHLTDQSLSGDTISAGDVEDYLRFRGLTKRFGAVLGKLASRPPPRLGQRSAPAHLEVARAALAARRLHRGELRELLRVGSSNVHDVLGDYLGHEQVRAALAMDGVLGAALGPRSNNSMLNLLHRCSAVGSERGPGAGARAAGPGAGLSAFIGALAIAAREHGVQVRTSAPVRRVLLDGMRAAGVELDSGEQLFADAVVSSLDVRTTLLELVGRQALEADVIHRVQCVRAQGRAAKLHLALDRMPDWRGVDPGQLAAGGRQLRFLVAPDRRTIERAFDPAKYGEVPSCPAIEFTLPSLHDPTLCATGRHVLSAVVQHAPYTPRDGAAAARQALQEAAITVLASIAPDLADRIVAAELLLPVDLERIFGIHGGHWHHGELSVDQYFTVRPMAGHARYASPVEGLWLCGAGTHPGGNVTGTAGYNAAGELLRAAGRQGQ